MCIQSEQSFVAIEVSTRSHSKHREIHRYTIYRLREMTTVHKLYILYTGRGVIYVYVCIIYKYIHDGQTLYGS